MKPKRVPKAEQIEASDGWLVPDGTLYPCKNRGHGQLACDLGYRYLNGFSFDPRLYHLTGGNWLRMSGAQPPTQAQLDFIWDWCQHRGRKLPVWLRHVENRGGPSGKKNDR